MKKHGCIFSSSKVATSFLVIATLMVNFSGCSTSSTLPAERAFLTTYRQSPPEPVYYRVFMARPPEIIPEAGSSSKETTSVRGAIPVVQLQLENVTLEEACGVLATTARYECLVSQSLSERKISIQGQGTIEELASKLAQKAQVTVFVDNELREIHLTPLGTSAVAAESKHSSKKSGDK